MDAKILQWAASANFEMMSFAALYLREIIYALAVTLLLIGITPISFQKDQTNTQALLVIIRKIFVYMSGIIAAWLIIMATFFEFTNVHNDPDNYKLLGRKRPSFKTTQAAGHVLRSHSLL